MAGLEAIEPPTINISISGKSSSASGCSIFQKPIVSHPPGEPSLTLNFQKRAPIQYKRNHSDSLGILDVFTASGSILLHCPIYWLWKMRNEAVCCFSNTFGRVFTHSEAIKALTSTLALKHLTECLRSLTNHSQALVQELNLNFSKFSRLQEYVYSFLILSLYYDLVYM
uniref:Uncharacterized protein n=1 Tax=Glossina palpalis gambiensis TaxID=67801 RepID=A0A1B0BFR8_9MUSC